MANIAFLNKLSQALHKISHSHQDFSKPLEPGRIIEQIKFHDPVDYAQYQWQIDRLTYKLWSEAGITEPVIQIPFDVKDTKQNDFLLKLIEVYYAFYCGYTEYLKDFSIQKLLDGQYDNINWENVKLTKLPDDDKNEKELDTTLRAEARKSLDEIFTEILSNKETSASKRTERELEVPSGNSEYKDGVTHLRQDLSRTLSAGGDQKSERLEVLLRYAEQKGYVISPEYADYLTPSGLYKDMWFERVIGASSFTYKVPDDKITYINASLQGEFLSLTNNRMMFCLEGREEVTITSLLSSVNVVTEIEEHPRQRFMLQDFKYTDDEGTIIGSAPYLRSYDLNLIIFNLLWYGRISDGEIHKLAGILSQYYERNYNMTYQDTPAGNYARLCEVPIITIEGIYYAAFFEMPKSKQRDMIDKILDPGLIRPVIESLRSFCWRVIGIFSTGRGVPLDLSIPQYFAYFMRLGFEYGYACEVTKRWCMFEYTSPGHINDFQHRQKLVESGMPPFLHYKYTPRLICLGVTTIPWFIWLLDIRRLTSIRTTTHLNLFKLLMINSFAHLTSNNCLDNTTNVIGPYPSSAIPMNTSTEVLARSRNDNFVMFHLLLTMVNPNYTTVPADLL